MSSSDRLLRKQARTRGSGYVQNAIFSSFVPLLTPSRNRNVQRESFYIVDKPLTSKQMKLINKLQSALIDSEEIENLPRFRSRNSTIDTSISDNQEESPGKQKVATPDAIQDNAYKSPARSGVASSTRLRSALRTPPRSKTARNTSREPLEILHPNSAGKPKSKVVTKPSKKTTKRTSNKTGNSRLASSTKSTSNAKSASRLLKSLESSFNEIDAKDTAEQQESPNSRLRRILANVIKRNEQYKKPKPPKTTPKQLRPRNVSVELLNPSPAPSQSQSQSQEQSGASTPVPLSKTRATERQKPLIIDLERITNNSNKAFKVNTIDVLKSLVQNFDPHLLGSSTINEIAAQNDFKNHMLYHLNALLDMYTSINDITQTIKQVQKQKDNVRQRIFELQEDHTRVGQELNTVRNGHRKVNEQHEQIENVSRELQKLQNMEGKTDINDIVQQQLREMTKTIAPGVGVYAKLRCLNEKLTDIDQELT